MFDLFKNNRRSCARDRWKICPVRAFDSERVNIETRRVYEDPLTECNCLTTAEGEGREERIILPGTSVRKRGKQRMGFLCDLSNDDPYHPRKQGFTFTYF